MAGFRTGLVLLVDGGKPRYRDPFSLARSIPGSGTPLEILKRRLNGIPGIEGPILLIPEGPDYETLRQQAEGMGLACEIFNEDKVVEQPIDWRPEHWGIPDDSGIDCVVGTALATIADRKRWETLVVVPLKHLLVDTAEIILSLRVHEREAYDASFTADRVPGAGWSIFQNELLQGMQKSHAEIMTARGGLI